VDRSIEPSARVEGLPHEVAPRLRHLHRIDALAMVITRSRNDDPGGERGRTHRDDADQREPDQDARRGGRPCEKDP
jgi:hypothetical protein